MPVRAIPVTNASPIFIFAATMPIERLKNKDQETQLDSCTDQSGCRRHIATASSARDWGLGEETRAYEEEYLADGGGSSLELGFLSKHEEEYGFPEVFFDECDENLFIVLLAFSIVKTTPSSHNPIHLWETDRSPSIHPSSNRK